MRRGGACARRYVAAVRRTCCAHVAAWRGDAATLAAEVAVDPEEKEAMARIAAGKERSVEVVTTCGGQGKPSESSDDPNPQQTSLKGRAEIMNMTLEI